MPGTKSDAASNNQFDFFSGSNARHFMDLTAYRLELSESNFLSSAGGIINKITSKISSDAASVIDYNYANFIGDVKSLVSDGNLTESIAKFVKSYTDIVESGGKINKQSPDFTFRLPIPQNLDSQLSHKYDSDSQTIKDMFGKPSSPDSTKEDNATQKVTKKVFGLAVDASTKIMQRQHNVALNPHLITTYDETDLRVFRYSTPIIPYSKEHSKIISTGIAKLKELSAGAEMEGDVGLFIHQPYVWTISFGSRDAGNKEDESYGAKLNKEISQILRISNFTQFNITAININYSKGNMLLMEDGLPKLFELTISLQERMPYRRGFFQNKE